MDPGQWNGYTYGGGNPVVNADPSGAMYPPAAENGPHSYGCGRFCWASRATRAYDRWHDTVYLPERYREYRESQAALRRQEEAGAYQDRILREEAWYRETHAGWRAPTPAPRPAPRHHSGGGFLHDLGSVVHSTAHWVSKHKIAILLTVGAVALAATGVGLAVDGGLLVGGLGVTAETADVIGTTSGYIGTASGLVSFAADTNDCMHGSGGACLGAVGGFAGLGYGTGSLFGEGLGFTASNRATLDTISLAWGAFGYGSDFIAWARDKIGGGE